MVVVDNPLAYPAVCVASGLASSRLVDFGPVRCKPKDGMHIFIEPQLVLNAAELLGGGEVRDDSEVVALRAEIEELRARLAEAVRFRESMVYTFEQFFREEFHKVEMKKKPGRPKQSV